MHIRSDKRRRYIVKRGLQLRYVAVILVYMSMTAVVVGSLLYIEIWGAIIPEFSEAKLSEKLEVAAQLRAYEDVRSQRLESPAMHLFREAELLSVHERSVVAEILAAANARLIPKLLILFAAIACASILVSHRIAGPLYRLGRSVREVSEGNLTTRFALRKGDELKDLAGALEVMVRSLRHRMRHALTSVKALSSELQRYATVDGGGTEGQRLLAGLRTRTATLEKDLSTFTLE